jgi:hypothetical protein
MLHNRRKKLYMEHSHWLLINLFNFTVKISQKNYINML